MQADFFHIFPRLRWIKLNNQLEKHKVRQYTEGVSLLYILAERNMAQPLPLIIMILAMFNSSHNQVILLSLSLPHLAAWPPYCSSLSFRPR